MGTSGQEGSGHLEPVERGFVAVAIEKGYKDGLKRGAAFADEKGQRELAAAIRRLAEERENRP